MRRLVALLPVAAALAAHGASGASALLVPEPASFAAIRARIHAEGGAVVGSHEIESVRRADGTLYVRSEAWLGGRSVNLREAVLERAPAGGGRYRPVWQHERMATGVEGEDVELEIDHAASSLACRRGEGTVRSLALPEGETIGNVVATLALQPLAAGAVERLRFQLAVCRTAPRLVDVEARVERRGDGAVEIGWRYQLGWMLAPLAWLLPEVRVWLGARPPHDWLGSRVPLHLDGPQVTVVREHAAGADRLVPR